jgi:hypothetical protein
LVGGFITRNLIEIQKTMKTFSNKMPTEIRFMVYSRRNKFHKDLKIFIMFKGGMANPNRSLGRIRPIFDKNCKKTLKISKNHPVSIQDWAAEIPFWAAGWPPLV